MNNPKDTPQKYDDWVYLNAAAKTITDFRDWLMKNALSCSGTPDLRFGQRDGKPHLFADMTIAIPFQPVTGITPTNGASKSPRSSAAASRTTKSRKISTTASSDNGDVPVEQNAAVS